MTATPSCSDILLAVAAAFEVTVSDITGPSKLRKHIRARFAAYWLATRIFGKPGCVAARGLKRDRSTIQASCVRVATMLRSDADFAKRVQDACQMARHPAEARALAAMNEALATHVAEKTISPTAANVVAPEFSSAIRRKTASEDPIEIVDMRRENARALMRMRRILGAASTGMAERDHPQGGKIQ